MRKIVNDNKGFTLTEVMIGIMILTVAIVSASNMLVTLLKANQVNLTSLQAYYFAEEGLEGFRNIRDTNWLHNRNWLGSDMVDLWGETPELGNGDFGDSFGLEYSKNFLNAPDVNSNTLSQAQVAIYSPWRIVEDSSKVGSDSNFTRSIRIQQYSGCTLDLELGCENDKTVLVESKVEWSIGADDRELVLYTILTDWKGGVF